MVFVAPDFFLCKNTSQRCRGWFIKGILGRGFDKHHHLQVDDPVVVFGSLNN